MINKKIFLHKTWSLTTGTNSFTGNTGDDTFDAGLSTSSLQTLNSGDQLAGGAGTDELYAVINGSVTPALISGIENVSITNVTTAATIDFSNATGITSLVNQASTIDMSISGVSSALAVTVRDTSTTADQTITYNDVTGSADSATVGIINVTGGNATLIVPGVETLTLNATGSTANVLAGVTAAAATNLNITGTAAVTPGTLSTTITTVDGSAHTGTGASGLTITTSATTTTTVTGGTGNDAINTSNSGGADSITGGAGNDTVTYTAGLDVTDTISGGYGTGDRLVTTSALAAAYALPTTPTITGFETLRLSTALGAALSTANVQAGITTLDLRAGSGTFTATLETGAQKVLIGPANAGVLTVADTGTATTDSLAITNSGGSTGLVAYSMYGGQNLAVTGFETVTINGTGGGTATQAAGTITLTADSSGTTTLNFTGSNTHTTGIITANVIDASGLTGSAVLTMVGASVGTTKITGSTNADTLVGDSSSSISGGAGADTITGGSGNDTLLGGAGNDTITTSGGATDSVDGGADNDTIVAVLTAGNTIAGGAGTDVLSIGAIATAATATGVSGFETLLAATANVTHVMSAFLDNSTFTTLQDGVATGGGAVVFSNAASTITNLETTIATASATMTRLVDTTSSSLNVVLLGSATTTLITANDEETINLSSDSTSGATIITTLTATDLTTLNITGSNSISIGTLSSNSTSAGSTLTITGSANTGGISVDATNSILDAVITGSSTASSTISGGGGADSVTGGTSADTIAGGVGADTLTGGSGADTFQVTSGVASYTGGTPGTASLFETISDYVLGTDIIDETGAALALSPDATTTAASGVAGISRTTGIATFNIADSTLALRVAAVNASLLAGTEATNQFAIFQFSGSTYVYIYDDTLDTVAALDGLIKLTGITGVTAIDIATSAGDLILS